MAMYKINGTIIRRLLMCICRNVSLVGMYMYVVHVGMHGTWMYCRDVHVSYKCATPYDIEGYVHWI